jgi:hypothetical protein
MDKLGLTNQLYAPSERWKRKRFYWIFHFCLPICSVVIEERFHDCYFGFQRALHNELPKHVIQIDLDSDN